MSSPTPAPTEATGFVGFARKAADHIGQAFMLVLTLSLVVLVAWGATVVIARFMG
jgi:hypothetical protein